MTTEIVMTESHLQPTDQLADSLNQTTDNSNAFAFDSLEAVRKKLLDLGGRNSLLNYRHPKKDCMRLIDELPDQICRVLRENKKFTFIPVPEPTEAELIEAGFTEVNPETQARKVNNPTAAQWAEHLGFAIEYDLPENTAESVEAGIHQDTRLQTLVYAPELEARLRGIRATAETAIEESGTHILFMALGFLEWFESAESDAARLAPLFTLPVTLERSSLGRGESTYHYTISLKDDGLISNITLREKLANDFALGLPVIEEDTTPEQYFQLIQNTILQHQPRWRIRRQASLILLNFAKQAMYQDLDPAKWPTDARIDDHPVVKKFFSSVGSDSESYVSNYAQEHPIDLINDVHDRFPLIFDADSSQHSALIDAVNGENLVIEGPPGSGKSQTITNLIAACIGNGRKVLFVAEKMAALNVVKHRLDMAELGDFCLELHSHKTHKPTILRELKSRLEKQGTYRLPSSIDTEIIRFEDLKHKLAQYAELINSPWCQTGMSLHTIFNKSTRHREQLKLNPDQFKITGIDGQTFTLLKQKELFDQADMLADIYDRVSEQAPGGKIANHYWYGVCNTELMGYQAEVLNKHLEEWNCSLLTLRDYWQEQIVKLEMSIDANTPVAAIQTICKALEQLPALQGGELFPQLQKIAVQQNAFGTMLDDYRQLHKDMDSLSTMLKPARINDPVALNTLRNANEALWKLGLAKETTLTELSQHHDRLAHLSGLANNIGTQFQQMLPSLPADFQTNFTVSLNGLKEFLAAARLIKQLPAELWQYRHSVYGKPAVDGQIERLSAVIPALIRVRERLSAHFDLQRLPSVSVLKNIQVTLDGGGFFRIFSSAWKQARQSVLQLSSVSRPDKKTLLKHFSRLVEYAEGIAQLDRINQNEPILNELYCGLDTPLERIAALRTWYKAVQQEYGIGFGDRVTLGNTLLSLDQNLAMGLDHAAQQGLYTQASELLEAILGVGERFTEYRALIKSDTVLATPYSPLFVLAQILNFQLSALTEIVQGSVHTLASLAATTEKLAAMSERIAAWQQAEPASWLVPEHLQLSTIAGEFSAQAYEAGMNTLVISRVIEPVPALLNAIAAAPGTHRYNALQACLPELKACLNASAETKIPFLELGKIKPSQWEESSGDAIGALIQRNRAALSNPNWLNTWLEYIQLKNKLSATGLDAVITGLETHTISTHHLGDLVQLAVHHQLALEVLAQQPSLAQFSGMEQMAIRKKFREYDHTLLRLQRQKIAYKAAQTQIPEGSATGRVSNYTEAALIRHEAAKTTRHIALRELLKRSGTAIQALKPCFMMSPMSVAQYLEPGKFKFDLVVMDEASQIRPEDALGAIARGGSLVVVGDPKQLPPTSFFQTVTENDEDIDTVALQESESILETVMPMFKTRRLRWHYRSRHESLIAFSNQQFYDSNLILFPSPFRDHDEFGIRFNPVERGRFVSGINVEEAKQIVAAAARQMIDHPEETVGIVAMNTKQREEIEKQLDQLGKDDFQFRTAYEKNLELDDPLFIKNLENVQGDERDVIIISMTYGPEQAGGRVMQRFFPINSDTGWRRLNVLFTRSKKRMIIFSSMGSGDIVTGTDSKKGVKSLKAFLDYCETGHLHHARHTGKVPDSDFEIAVMRALDEQGYECEPQLGVAGYFLDIAVKDPGQPGRFLMGIECDGATYHSAKSTRDRDRLRQDILEGLGWCIRRIWSTDWFKNPQAQLQSIFHELEQLKSSVVLLPADTTNETPVDAVAIDLVAEDTESDLINDESSQNLPGDQQSLLDEYIPSQSVRLRERLSAFGRDVIQRETPNTDSEHQLLRPAMLDAILSQLPRSKAEFQELIPAYLRSGTAAEEGKYLEHVLDLVSEYS